MMVEEEGGKRVEGRGWKVEEAVGRVLFVAEVKAGARKAAHKEGGKVVGE